jgi:hypothetical protein
MRAGAGRGSRCLRVASPLRLLWRNVVVLGRRVALLTLAPLSPMPPNAPRARSDVHDASMTVGYGLVAVIAWLSFGFIGWVVTLLVNRANSSVMRHVVPASITPPASRPTGLTSGNSSGSSRGRMRKSVGETAAMYAPSAPPNLPSDIAPPSLVDQSASAAARGTPASISSAPSYMGSAFAVFSRATPPPASLAVSHLSAAPTAGALASSASAVVAAAGGEGVLEPGGGDALQGPPAARAPGAGAVQTPRVARSSARSPWARWLAAYRRERARGGGGGGSLFLLVNFIALGMLFHAVSWTRRLYLALRGDSVAAGIGADVAVTVFFAAGCAVFFNILFWLVRPQLPAASTRSAGGLAVIGV